MSEKLVITKEQHDAVIKALGNRKGDRAQLIGDHSVIRGCEEHGVLNELTVSDMARIVYDGDYEVEQHKFQVGDMVTWDGLGEVLQISNIYSVGGKLSCNFESAAGCCLLDGLRRATEEEIYWLYELGRDKVGDFREGDVIITQEMSYRYSTDGEVDTIGPHTTQLWLDEGIIKGIYPTESFKSFKKEQSK